MSETAADSVEWQLKPGDQIERKALHSKFGGEPREASGRQPRHPTSSSSRILSPGRSTATTTTGCRMVASTTAGKASTATSG